MRRVTWAVLLSGLVVLPGLTTGASGSSQAGGEVRLTVKVPPVPDAAPDPPSSAIVRLVPGEGLTMPPLDRRFPLAPAGGPLEAVLTLPAGSRWQLEVEIPGLWVPRRSLEVEAGRRSLVLDALPAGIAEGILTLPPALSAQQLQALTLTATFQSSPGATPELPRSEQPCTLAGDAPRERRFACHLPAGRLDLRLVATGFQPIYVWGADVPAFGKRGLSRLELLAGASVAGSVVAEGRWQPAETEAVLAPLAAGFPRVGTSRREALELRAEVSARGFFQFRGVPPGSYELVVHHPDFATARMRPVPVQTGEETRLEAVELVPRSALDVLFEPPVDPFLQPWRVRLLREADPGRLSTVAEGPATADGLWRLEGLDAGLYRVSVEDSRGSQWAHEQVEVAPDLPGLRIDLPYVRLEGLLTLAEEPVAADLWFGGRHGSPRIGIRSNEEGRFYVFLPLRDEWVVDVAAEGSGVAGRFEGVRVPPRPAGQRWAKIELELPATRLEGEVVDAMSNPVVGVQVDVMPHRSQVAAGSAPSPGTARTTAEDGSFEAIGLRPGRWLVQARDEGATPRQSEFVEVTVREEDTPTPVRLVLHDLRSLSGLVVTRQGQPVAGSQVVAVVEQPGGLGRSTQLWTPEAFTNAEGAFELELPPAAAAAQLTIFPPGFAVHQQRVPLPAEGPVVVEVDGEAQGTLVLRYSETSPQDLAYAKLTTTVLHDYVLGHYLANQRWAALHGVVPEPDEVRIPALPAGIYTACQELEGASSGRWQAPVQARGCVEGHLPPGGELVLELASRALAPASP